MSLIYLMVWQKFFKTRLVPTFLSLATRDGGLVFAGQKAIGEPLYNCWIVKFEALGEIAFWRHYSCINTEYITETQDGGYLLGGSSHILKLDSAGNFEWGKTYQGISLDVVIASSTGGYYFAGSMNRMGVIGKLDENGELPGCGEFETTAFDTLEKFPLPPNNVSTTVDVKIGRSNLTSAGFAVNTMPWPVTSTEICSELP